MPNEIIRREAHATGVRVREAREGEDESREIEGYALVFGQESVNFGDEEHPIYETINREAVTRELLDSSDIKMTMFHNRELLLARSNRGSGTLGYEIDEKGVKFSFAAPNTSEGEKALEAVRRGDISGCSFAFALDLRNKGSYAESMEERDGKTVTLIDILEIAEIYDFTLAVDPAYPQTECSAREYYLNKETGTTAAMEAHQRDLNELEGLISELSE